MKNALLLAALVASLITFQSCEKEHPLPSPYPIEGQWIGTYNIEQAMESGNTFYYSFFLRKDDTIQVHSQGADGNTYYGFGTWNLEDSVFTANITTTNSGQAGAQQSVTAIYDKKKGLLRNGRVESTTGFFLASFELKKAD